MASSLTSKGARVVRSIVTRDVGGAFERVVSSPGLEPAGEVAPTRPEHRVRAKQEAAVVRAASTRAET